jgi:putative transposase
MLLNIKGMARSTYYYNIKQLRAPDLHEELRERIAFIYNSHKGRYGYRRITLQLREEGVIVNHKTVQKLMGQMSLKAKRKRSKYKSYKGEVGKMAPNILERDFIATEPNRKWATDITEVKINDKKIYLSPILDMFNGEIVSYTISDRPHLGIVTGMLKKALKKTKDTEGLIFHSDQGWHYQHMLFQSMLKEKGIVQSMSRKGNCLDNAMMENFFGLMKTELLYIREWNDIDEFKTELVKYISYYNNDRIKLRLKGKSPVKYRALFQSKRAS